MHGLEPLKYDFGAADALIRAAEDARNALNGQAGSRESNKIHGKEDFKGYFSELFEDNAAGAAVDRILCFFGRQHTRGHQQPVYLVFTKCSRAFSFRLRTGFGYMITVIGGDGSS